MVEVKTIYKCDICGKESETNYMKIALPIPYYTASDYQMGHNRTDSISTFNGEVCKDCCKKIIKSMEAVCEQYGEYAYAGKYIKWAEVLTN